MLNPAEYAQSVMHLPPHQVMPEQLRGRYGAQWEPEKRLLRAILDDALQVLRMDIPDWKGRRVRGTRQEMPAATHRLAERMSRDNDLFAQQKRDRQWMLSTSQHPFSFVHICDVLGLEPDAVRKEVLGQ